MKVKSLVLTLFLSLVSIVQPAWSQSIQSDFDKDGISDFSFYEAGSDKVLSWNYQSGASSLITGLTSVGSLGDVPILARWKGTGIPQVGVVAIDPAEKDVVWRIVNDQGVVEERQFGTTQDSILSGADFDGNGYADASTAVLKKNRVQWQISYDLFFNAVGQERVSKIQFGKSGDRIFYASPDGVSDWIGVFGKGPDGQALLRLKSLVTGEVRTSTRFPKSLTESTRPRPFPIRQDNGTDILGFVSFSSRLAKFNFRTLTGDVVLDTVLETTGEVTVGNYNDGPGEEVAVKSSTGITVLNPNTGLTTAVALATSGTPMDEYNVAAVSPSTSTNNNSGNSGGSTGNGGKPSSVSSCRSTAPWPGSYVYKTVGSDHFSDPRRFSANVLMKPGAPGPFPSCIDLVDTKGNVVSKLGLYARGAGWAARYYGGFGCGSGTPLSGSSVANKARANTGSSNVYANSDGVCYGPIDAAKCIGSAHC